MMEFKEEDWIGLIGIIIIIVSAANFLVIDWNILATIEFLIVCFGVSYLINKGQKKCIPLAKSEQEKKQ